MAADLQAPHADLLAAVNTQIRIEVARRYDVSADPSSVRAGWHSAMCNVGVCEWSTSGLESNCDDAGAEHVAEVHGGDGPIPALEALFAVLKLHKPQDTYPSGGPTGRLLCFGCDIDGYDAEHPEWPCRTVGTIAARLGVTVGG